MITILPESAYNVVGIRVTGRLTGKDYETVLIPTLEDAFQHYGRLRLLVEMDETFEGWDLDAAWDDLTFGLRHRADFEKMALVGAPKWVEWATKALAFLFAGEIRFFPREERDDAWAWVRS